MKQNEIIKELKKIQSIWDMSNEELIDEFPFVTEKILNDQRYPVLLGITEAKIKDLIRAIEGKIKKVK